MFIQARNYTRGRKQPIELIVVHDMEAPELRDTAENVGRWFAGPTAPQASAHYLTDVDSVVQSVQDTDTAWHAPGANSNGIGIEHAGFARQTQLEWGDPYSEQMLIVSAGVVADLCKRWKIPPVFVPASTLVQHKYGGARGITTHHEVDQAFHLSSHYDPGPNFPMAHYLALIQWKMGVWGPIPPQEDMDMTDDEKRLMFAYLQAEKDRGVEIVERLKVLQTYAEDTKNKLK